MDQCRLLMELLTLSFTFSEDYHLFCSMGIAFVLCGQYHFRYVLCGQCHHQYVLCGQYHHQYVLRGQYRHQDVLPGQYHHHYVLRANVVSINYQVSSSGCVTWSVSLLMCSSLDYLNIALPLCDYLLCINHISVGRKI